MSLVAQYLFKNNANDETDNYNGSSINVTYENVPSDKNFGGKVAVFNGSSSYISLPQISAIAETAAKTFEFWAYAGNRQTTAVFSFGTNNDSSVDLRKTLTLQPYDSNGSSLDIMMGTTYYNLTPSLSEWHHFVYVFAQNSTTTNAKLYVDGQAIAIKSYTGSYTINPRNLNAYRIGCMMYLSRGTQYYWFNGKIANFRIYNASLSEDEILQHYQKESSALSHCSKALLLNLI